MNKKIVCFGGGSVVPKIILEPLKDLGFNVVGITSMIDVGGSTGAFRREFIFLPPGDLMRRLLALSDCQKKKIGRKSFGILDLVMIKKCLPDTLVIILQMFSLAGWNIFWVILKRRWKLPVNF
jgi:hypothetical protein